MFPHGFGSVVVFRQKSDRDASRNVHPVSVESTREVEQNTAVATFAWGRQHLVSSCENVADPQRTRLSKSHRPKHVVARSVAADMFLETIRRGPPSQLQSRQFLASENRERVFEVRSHRVETQRVFRFRRSQPTFSVDAQLRKLLDELIEKMKC